MNLQIRRRECTSDASERVDQQSSSSMAKSAEEFALAELNRRMEAPIRDCNELRAKMRVLSKDNEDLWNKNSSL